MIKNLFFNWEEVVKKCIDITYEYLKENPKTWTEKKKQITRENISYKIQQFLFKDDFRIKPPGTIPDELVADMLEEICGMDSRLRTSQQKAYNQQKQVEMKMGFLLELYVLSNSFEFGWVQTGDCIRGVDMLKKKEDGSWFELQIKNSNNTTNSSSAGFIKGKAIIWHRRNAMKGNDNWMYFPDENVRHKISANEFKKFLINHFSID
jgi:CRISPR/Cas system CSM-associated protein Csm5 (group 7 of RAMP superfamily)